MAYITVPFWNPSAMTPAQSGGFAGAASGAMQSEQLLYQQMVQERYERAIMKERYNQEQLQTQMMQERLAEERQAQRSQAKIVAFSDSNPPVFLGCINCSSNAKDSIFNPKNSFWNKKYSSTHSNFSACNIHALRPPVLYGPNIRYGFLTLNTQLPGAVTKPGFKNWINRQLCHNKFEEGLRGVKK